MDACMRVNAPHVIHESIDGEVIVIDLGTGNYYSLKGSGADVWDALARAGSVTQAALVDALAARFDARREELDAGVTALLADLRQEGLIVDDATNGAAPEAIAPDPSVAKSVFTPPQLEKFTDMQDLVLLDPVHEVDATGWPQRRPDDVAAA